MNSLSVSRHQFFSFVIRALAILGVVTGLIGVSPALTTQAQAVDRPAPMVHTIDYVVVSTTSDTSNPSATRLAEITQQTSDHWKRMSRGVVSEIRMGQLATVPNIPASAICAWTKDTISDVVATALGHSLDIYKGQPNGRALVMLASDCGTGYALATGTGLSSGGIILVNTYASAETLAHELGHTFGLYHASAVPQDCMTKFWDGPYSLNTEILTPSGCGLGDTRMTAYGDSGNIMGSSTALAMDLNGQQKYQLGLIQPGAGMMQVTATASEQLITVHDRHTPDLGVPQTIRMTADDPDGPGGCAAPEYGIDYDPLVGGVVVFRIAIRTDCSTRVLLANLSSPSTIAWSVPVSVDTNGYGTTRTFLLPGESRLTQSGNVEVKVVSADPGSGTARVSIRRTDVPGATSLQVTSKTLGSSTTMTALEQQLTGKVTTNQASWSASSNQSWATVTPSGTNGQTITVSVAVNPTPSERTATITVRAGSSTTTMNLVQRAGDEGLANDCAASTATTCTWADLTKPLTGTIDIIGERDWIKITPVTTGTYVFTSSQGEAPLWNIARDMYDAAGNWMVGAGSSDSTQSRYSAYLVAGETYFLQIAGWGQTGAFKLTATTTPSVVTVSPIRLSTPGGPDTLTFQINTSQDWTLSTSRWFRATQTSGTGSTSVTLTIPENTTGEARTGLVAVSAGGQAVGVTVTQEYNDDCGDIVLLSCTWADITKPVSGRIDYTTDYDWFKFIPPTTGTWVVTTSGAATDPTVARGEVMASDGSAVGYADKTGDRFVATVFLTAGRTYFVKVYGYEQARPGNYTVSAATSDAVSLAISPPSFDFPGEGGTENVEVGTNGPWRVDIPSDWVTLSPSSGDGTTMVTVSVPPNTTGVMRWDSVRLKAGDQTKTVSVSQGYVTGPVLVVSPTSVDAAADGGSKPVQVTSSGSWTATGPSWVTISPSSGSGDKPVTVNVAPNTGGQARTDKISFKSGDLETLLTVNQAAQPQVILTVDRTTLNLAAGVDKQTVQVTASGSWTVTGPSWVSLSRSSGTGDGSVDITSTANTTGQARTERVTFTSGTKTATVEITQQPQPTDDCGQTTSTACDWSDLANPVNGRAEVGDDVDWYRITPRVGGVWTFTSSAPAVGGLPELIGSIYDANGNLVDGSANVGFVVTQNLVANTTYYVAVRNPYWGRTGAYTVTATAPVRPVVSVSPTRWDPSAASVSQTVQVSANSSWQVSVPDWITASRLSGSGDGPVTLTVTPNLSTQSRSYSVKFTVSGMEASVVVTQAGQVQTDDDCGNTAATACVWSNLATPVNGRIEVGGDKDWYKVTPTSSGVWRFTSSGGLPDAYGTLMDGFGGVLTSNDDANYPSDLNFSLSWYLVAGNTYYLEAKDRLGSSTGAYVLTAIAPEIPVILVSPPTWNPLPGGANQVVQVTSNASWVIGGLPDWITASQAYGGGNRSVTLTATPNASGLTRSASVVFSVSGMEARVSVTQVAQTQPADDCGNTAATACNWSDLGTPVNGRIEVGGDKDWYKITPPVSGSWTFTSSGGLYDPLGTLMDSSGRILETHDDISYPSNRQFAVTKELVAGTTYYLEVWAYFGGTGVYTLTATGPQASGGDDCGETFATACTWSNLGTPVNGRIEVSGDRDWYQFTPTVSGTWTFTSSGGLYDPYGSLMESTGRMVAYNDDISYPANRQFAVTAQLVAGTTYYLDIWAFRPGTGPYTITATRA